MCLIGLPVPAGFTVTTECCVDYFKAGGKYPASLAGEVKAALKKVEKDMVTEYATVGSIGIPIQVIARDARLLRGDDGFNQYCMTNSVTLGGGESADVILDTSSLTPNTTYFIYATNLHFLSNDTENFGGMMTEIRIQ